MNLTMRRFTSKWMSTCIGTGKNMERWKLRNEGYCPFCTSPQEDTEHILLCQHADAIQAWKDNLKQYLTSMLKIDTCPKLLHAIKLELTAWKMHTNPPNLDQYPTTIKRLMFEQRKIGWQNFLEGLRTVNMSKYMRQHYAKIKSMKTGQLWGSRTHQYGWKLIYKTWEQRNEQLHKTQRIADMEGMVQVKQSITNEYQRGIGRLPASEFSHLF